MFQPKVIIILAALFAPNALADGQAPNPNSCAGCSEMSTADPVMNSKAEFWKSYIGGNGSATELIATLHYKLVLVSFDNECSGSGSCTQMQCWNEYNLSASVELGSGPNAGTGGVVLKWINSSVNADWSHMNLPTANLSDFPLSPQWQEQKNPEDGSNGNWKVRATCGKRGTHLYIKIKASSTTGTEVTGNSGVKGTVKCAVCEDPVQ